MTDADPRRALPPMDALLSDPRAIEWSEVFGREPVKRALARALEAVRQDPGRASGAGSPDAVIERAVRELSLRSRPSLLRVLNGTGVVLHTNLGRAVLADEAIDAQRAAAGYSNLELSLDTGERGSRYDHCAGLLRELTGAAGAVAANNNAAAVSLCVNELARDREVIVSRGELVEIGGTFRIPDVIARSGATLREVGTTNRTRARDYERAISERTGMILRVHPSNYRVEGFAGRPGLEELVAVARDHGLPLVHDVGSGLLSSDLLPGFPEEPTVRGSIAAGVALVTLSGDKLLGGPQAGLIVGDAGLVGRMRENPLLRAFRVDKTTLAALEATLLLHRDADLASRRIPTLRMLRETQASVVARAEAGLAAARAGTKTGGEPAVRVGHLRAVVGGGSFPGFELDSAGWIIEGASPDRLAATCRASDPPLIGRIHEDRFTVDVRTIAPGDEEEAARLLLSAVAESRTGGAPGVGT